MSTVSDSPLSTAGLSKSDPEYKRRKAAYLAAYRLRPEVETRRRYLRAEYRDNPDVQERERQLNRAWLQAHGRPPENRVKKADRRARQKAILKGAKAEHVARGVVWAHDGGICGICGTAADPLRWDLDHIVPLSRGGLHAYVNVHVTHPVCNRRKHDKDPRDSGSEYAYLLGRV